MAEIEAESENPDAEEVERVEVAEAEALGDSGPRAPRDSEELDRPDPTEPDAGDASGCDLESVGDETDFEDDEGEATSTSVARSGPERVPNEELVRAANSRVLPTNLFQPQPRPVLSVAESGQLFPIRRVFCVGRNYADHAREMGDDPNREEPFFFTKPADAVVELGHAAPSSDEQAEGPPTDGPLAAIVYPQATGELHHEVELVVALHRGGSDLTEQEASRCVFGFAVGNDLTRRDLQAVAKEKRRPWDLAKGFDRSALCTPLLPTDDADPDPEARIWLEVNGELRQEGTLGQLIWSVPELIAHLSRLVRLQPGDLIYTGTPAGVGALAPGDTVSSGVEGVGRLDFEIVVREDPSGKD